MSGGHREELIPSAARLLGSLRDLGYDFVNAVADVVDNSVSADATRVDITLRPAGADSWVRIADNGAGMGGPVISESMRLGTGQRTYQGDELGKFGLGLKTASLSQARAITVASRTRAAPQQIECRRLDLDDIQRSDRWEIEHLTAAEQPAVVTEPLSDGPGTVVHWGKLDRVLDFSDPFGSWLERHMMRLAERLDKHLGMVFGRFLTGQARRESPLVITVNGTTIDPWDPFCLNQRTEHLPVHELRVGSSFVRYSPYVLPPQGDFSDEGSWRTAGGPNQWNRQQGLYIYRADRMIQSGGWSWLRGNDEHIKLARAAVEFWPDLDEAFGINVAKTRVKLPEELRDQLKPLIAMLTRRADDRYRKSSPRGQRPAAPTRGTAPASTARGSTGAGRAAAGRTGTGTGRDSVPARQRVDGDNPPAPSGGIPQPRSAVAPAPPAGTDVVPGPDSGSVGEVLEQTARRLGHEAALQEIRNELRTRHPEAARDLGW